MKLRSEIPEEFKWDIDLFKTDEEIEHVFNVYENYINKSKNYYGKFNNPDIFFDYFLGNKNDLLLIQKFWFYLGNMQSVDGADNRIKKLIERMEVLSSRCDKAYAFADPQLKKLKKEYLLSLLKDERAKDLDNIINEIILYKKHSIDERTNKTISSINKSFNNSSEVFDILTNMEMSFDDALDSNGNTHKVSDATYGELVSSTDKSLRKNAFNSLMNGYGKLNQTFAALYLKEVKSNDDFAKLYKYKNKLDETLFDYVPEKVFRNNIKYVEKNIPVLQNFIKTVKKDTKNDDFAYYDLFEDKKINGKIDLETAKTLILSALSPLGEEYKEIVQRKFTDKSIDYLPNKDKTSGAYCSNCYGAKTLILMNWLNDFNSLSTLIHEMGHCVNAEYFNTHQPFTKADIPIFCAEIASTVNEILLNNHMQHNAKTEEKKYYLLKFLNDVRSTIFRQTLFTEFELFAHSSIEKEIPLTNEDLNEKYYELNKKYYGESCVIPENLKFEWSRIPHFYRPFYVFSYSTGLITAISIAQKLIEDKTYYKKYIHFLKNGSNKKPIEILKEIDIDLTTTKPFEDAFKYITQQLNEYKSLCK